MTRLNANCVKFAVKQIACEVERRLRPLPSVELDDSALRRELACCILSSQVSYESAIGAVEQIEAAGLFAAAPRSKIRAQAIIQSVLEKPYTYSGRTMRYRFPKTKSVQLAQAYEVIKCEFGSIRDLLRRNSESVVCREWLVANVPGMGPKQSSMFLRNAVGAFDLAVLDRHVFRYMALANVAPESTFQSVRNLRDYRVQEDRLRSHASYEGFSLGVFDWAIWIVMRAVAGVEKDEHSDISVRWA